MEITKDQIKNSIFNLYKKSNYPIETIYKDKNLFFDYSIIKAANDCSDELNTFVHKIIKSQYRPSNIVNDTIGSFLFGKHLEYYGEIPKECSPIYLNSLSDNFNNNCCNKQVWIRKSKNQLYKLPSAGRNERSAYLFTDEPILDISNTEKDILDTHGVLEVILMYYENGIYKEFTKFYTNTRNMTTKNINKEKKKKYFEEIQAEKNYMNYALLIFLIVIIIVLLMKR